MAAAPDADEIGARLAALAAAETAPDAVSRLARRIGEAAMWVFLVAILLSAWEVGARYVFNAPSTWIHATTTTLCAVGFALGGAYCMARREHIRVTFLTDRLPAGGRRFVTLFSLVVGVFYLSAFAYALWLDVRLALWRFDFEGRWNPELTPGPPNWPLPSIGKTALFVGALLFLAVTLAHLWRLVRRGG